MIFKKPALGKYMYCGPISETAYCRAWTVYAVFIKFSYFCKKKKQLEIDINWTLLELEIGCQKSEKQGSLGIIG